MTKIYHADLWGSREDKYRYLLEHDITTVEWTELAPASPAYLFIPQNIDLLSEYSRAWKITEIMPVNSTGIVTARDHFAVQWSSEDIWGIINNFVSLTVEEAREKYRLGSDSRDWQVGLAQLDIKKNEIDSEKVKPVLYRPFDIRYTYFTGHSRGFHCTPRGDVMRHMLSDNMAILTSRMTKGEDFGHIQATNLITEKILMSPKTSNNSFHFPLYLYPEPDSFDLLNQKRANFSQSFLTIIKSKLGYIPTPEAIFYYIYAIFHSPTYRDRYAEFLRGDFPRVPLTSSDQLFKDLGAKGEELVALHLMKSKKLNNLITKMGGDGDNAVTEVTYKPTEQRIYINKTRYFEGIAPEVWNFKIGGYQVLDKWLKDRKKAKRTLSFDDVLHYQKVVVALKETMQTMQAIDELIPSFPIE